MPNYEYQCEVCSHIQAVSQPILDAALKMVECPKCRQVQKHVRLVGAGLAGFVRTDTLTAIRRARKKHGYPEDMGSQQDAIDKYRFDRKAGTGKLTQKKKKPPK